jgi:hypothetical protein
MLFQVDLNGHFAALLVGYVVDSGLDFLVLQTKELAHFTPKVRPPR